MLLSNKIKLDNVLVWFLFSFLNYFIQSISNQLSNFPSKKNSLKYILRLLTGKFGWICTEFPLATFSAKNWKWIPLNFSTKSFNANYQKILFSNNSLRQILLSEFFFFFFCTRGYLHITTTLTISSMASKCIINWRVSTSPYSNLIDKILKACNVASYKIFFSRLIYFFSYTGRI